MLIKFTAYAGKIERRADYSVFTSMPFSSPTFRHDFEAKAKNFEEEVKLLMDSGEFQAWVKSLDAEKYNSLEIGFGPAYRDERKFPGFDKLTHTVKYRLSHQELSAYVSA